jgi:hypothetical protein
MYLCTYVDKCKMPHTPLSTSRCQSTPLGYLAGCRPRVTECHCVGHCRHCQWHCLPVSGTARCHCHCSGTSLSATAVRLALLHTGSTASVLALPRSASVPRVPVGRRSHRDGGVAVTRTRSDATGTTGSECQNLNSACELNLNKLTRRDCCPESGQCLVLGHCQ